MAVDAASDELLAFELPRWQCVGGTERELLRLRGDITAPAREAPDGHGGDAAGVADKTDQATLQRLLSLTPKLKLTVRDVTHASRRSPRPLPNTSTN